MVDLHQIQQEIVERLKPLEPEKIILFGSYADGTSTEDSDIDLFLVKGITEGKRDYEVSALMRLRDLTRKYHVGFDILSASQTFLDGREDFFYKVDVLQKGKVIYAQ